MSCITVESLPIIDFAHSFCSVGYQNCLCATPNCFEVSYVETGEVCLTQSGKEYHAVAGDLICNTKEVDLNLFASDMYEHFTAGFYFRHSNCTLPLVIHSSADTSYCRSIIQDIIRTHILYPGQIFGTAGLFLQLLNELDQIQTQMDSTSLGSHNAYVKLVKDYVCEHIHEPIRQADIASYIGITPEYLCKLFKQSEGVPLIPYINRVKLENMQILMRKEHITLQKASAVFGYDDPNYVSRLYKKMFGQNITDMS